MRVVYDGRSFCFYISTATLRQTAVCARGEVEVLTVGYNSLAFKALFARPTVVSTPMFDLAAVVRVVYVYV